MFEYIRDNRFLYNGYGGYGGPGGYIGYGTPGTYGGWYNEYNQPGGYGGTGGSWFNSYPAGGYGGYPGYGANGYWWIFALIILIAIVLQFSRGPGRGTAPASLAVTPCCNTPTVLGVTDTRRNEPVVDRSVLFIIVIFLLIICSCSRGCGGFGGYY